MSTLSIFETKKLSNFMKFTPIIPLSMNLQFLQHKQVHCSLLFSLLQRFYHEQLTSCVRVFPACYKYIKCVLCVLRIILYGNKPDLFTFQFNQIFHINFPKVQNIAILSLFLQTHDIPVKLLRKSDQLLEPFSHICREQRAIPGTVKKSNLEISQYFLN